MAKKLEVTADFPLERANVDPGLPCHPVARIYFVRELDVPGRAVASNVDATRPRSAHQVVFVPALRAFRITYTPPEGDGPQVCYVPETFVKRWDPAE